MRSFIRGGFGGGGGAGGAGSSDAQSIDGLTVDMTGASAGDILTYDGANIVASAPGITERTDSDGTVALVAGDRGTLVTASHATANAVSIAQAGTTGFEEGYYVYLCTTGAGVSTITPTTSTINGLATLEVSQGNCALIISDGTNYRASMGRREDNRLATLPGEEKTNDAATDKDFTSIYTIPANYLTAGRCIRVSLLYEITTGTSSVTLTRYLKMGSTKVFTSPAQNIGDGATDVSAWEVYMVCGTTTAGASAATYSTIVSNTLNGTLTFNQTVQPVNLATNGTLAIVPGVTYSGTGSTETIRLQVALVEKVN